MTTITMKEVAAFLLGEAPLDGFWFGERHPAGGFWWREHLRAALAAPATAQAAEIERLKTESEERLQNCAALVAENEQLRAAPATAPEQMPLERDCICHQYLHLDAYSGGAAPEGLHGALWVVVEGVRKKYVLADQSSEPKDMPALATTPKQPRPFVPWSKEAEMLESWAAQPATAPAQPAWHDAPTCEGMWVNMMSGRLIVITEETLEAWQNAAVRWYGPIPEDRQ